MGITRYSWIPRFRSGVFFGSRLVRLKIPGQDGALGAGSGDGGQIDAQLAGHLPGSGGRPDPSPPGASAGSGLCAACAAGGCGASGRSLLSGRTDRRRGGRFTFAQEPRDPLAHRDLVPLPGRDVGQDPGCGGFDLHDRLVGLDLHQGFAPGHELPLGLEPTHQDALLLGHLQRRHDHFSGHKSSPNWNRWKVPGNGEARL